MDMVGIATYLYHLAVEVITDSTKIAMQFCFYGLVYQRLAMFGAEYKVDVVFYE